ncbi:hypothetical protein [Comamonas sp. GB3 AK4-5]|uniref:hypothetical protein n=1 Tax=Comamonas sp. GB3 AK4-5 TaxID=3231487 RepID=UPI00351DEE31
MPHDVTPHPQAESHPANQDEEYLLSEPEAVLAATLALMTGFAHGCCPAHKGPMAAKVADQLGALVHSLQGPKLSCDMQALLLRLRTRWMACAAHYTAHYAADYAEQHMDSLRRQLHSQAEAATTAALAPRPDHPAATHTPEVLWHAPLETLQ